LDCSFKMRSKYRFVYLPCQHGTFSLRDRGDASARKLKKGRDIYVGTCMYTVIINVSKKYRFLGEKELKLEGMPAWVVCAYIIARK
jgi:hypothetical protein